ncbi:hypothetical protein ETU08_09100 [Apibacter muscae]|uniref:hypothetical protein n=1 Tax=Apibacter muscae TaxID=2509004 RepID=UPI0011AC2189|nr:hypothetical protein [Apibacter muscae]TWP28390.1 hypothetical protein ETU08_09100 [Apibacter muscae]
MEYNYQYMDKISKLIILRMASLKTIESSYQFNKIFMHIGSIASATRLLDELEQEKLISHEGIYDKDPSFYKKIKITEEGENYLQENLKNISFSNTEFNEHRIDLLNKIFGLS